MNKIKKSNIILSIIFIITILNSVGYSKAGEKGAVSSLFSGYTCGELQKIALNTPASLFKEWADPIILGENQSMFDGIAKRGDMLEFLSKLGDVHKTIQILEASVNGTYSEVMSIYLDHALGKALEALGTGVPGAIWTVFKSLNDFAVYLNNDILRLNINTFAIFADSDPELLGNDGVDIFLARYCRIDMETGWDTRRTLTTRIAVAEYATNVLNIKNFPAFGNWTDNKKNLNLVRSVTKSLLTEVKNKHKEMKKLQKEMGNALITYKKQLSILEQFNGVLDEIKNLACIECPENEEWYFSTRECECIEGYTENKDTDCIKEQDCDENEHWDEYEGACECNDGYTEDEDGECVKKRDCDENEYWDEDEGACECNDGYTEDENGDCVKKQDCDKNEYWDEDEGACECEDGYTEDENGDCVEQDEEKECNTNEEWNDDTKRCKCIEGYKKNEIDICVSIDNEEEEETVDEDICSIEYIDNLAFLLEFLVADTKLSETELISYINKFNKEINDQSSDPCNNSIIAYCYYSATEVAARM
ncbi:MAG: hypothetical protein GWP19_10900, partial [Planctomycetia bacterium]|nr:hypothetical protein [Planctomycetia bacterium]